MINQRKCGHINESCINQTLQVRGWIKKNRKLGSMIFIDLADKTGLIQIVVDQQNPNFQQIQKLSRESIIEVFGKVVARKSPNLSLKTGKYEIVLQNFKLIASAETTPIIIEDQTDGNEDTRLKYRYLDLRRPKMQKNIIFRSKFINACRQFLINANFVEIETPYLSKPTPEGARDYLVPTRNQINSFYALPQSPQIYKQLLMISGFESYFQIARCFRDEDLRSDRQPEFTQLDIEIAFANEELIMQNIEIMFQKVLKETMNIECQLPFLRLSYSDAINFYGSDKPDLRFDLKLIDISKYFLKTNCKIFHNLNDKKIIKAIIVNQSIAKSDINKLRKYAKDNKAFDLIWLEYENNKIIDGSIKNSVEPEIIQKIFNDQKIASGMIFVICDHPSIVNQALGAIRNILGDLLNLKDPNKLIFSWIIDWPLFEYDEKTKRFVAAHHPFTSPSLDTLNTFDKDQKNAKARAYDLVLNGFEIGGGSIRITDTELQKRMFQAIGIDQKQAQTKFGFLLEAFKYGAPPCGGIAIGLDRLLMILCHTETIRDVIAFPKNSHGIDVMMDTPSEVSENELNELHLKLK